MKTKRLNDFFAQHSAVLEEFIEKHIDSLQAQLAQNSQHAFPALEPTSTNAQPHSLFEAMRYSALGGGKRIRAMLVYMAAQAIRANDPPNSEISQLCDESAAAIECIHAYSLIHDDLPAMDDDDLRRGKPSCHIQFDEAAAILAGDALQTLAFQLLAQTQACQQRLELISCLAKASGAIGMVGGQAIDLKAVNQSLNYDELAHMHSLKTGALINASVEMGAICAKANSQQRQALACYAQHIGLAFQIKDDILDIEGTSEQLGKPQGADIAANKPTYPAILGIDEAKAKAQALCNAAIEALSIFDEHADPLRELASFIIDRSH